MNRDTIGGDWNMLKGRIRQKWAKLTDDDIGSEQGGFEELVGKIQKAYGYTKEKAMEEFESFKRNLNSDRPN